MKKFKLAFLLLFSLTFLSACTHFTNSKEDAILQAMGTGLLGSSINELDQDGRKLALESEYKALEDTPVGKTVVWRSENGRASGTVTAGQPYKVGSQNCRQYNHSFTINDVPQIAHGSACRNDDGTWSPLT